MSHLSIKKQLLSITLIPIIGFLYLSYNVTHHLNNEKNNLIKVDTYLQYVMYASQYIHNLQIERGLNSGFLESKGKKFKDKIPEQRIKSHNALLKIKKFILSNDIENKKKILNVLNNFNTSKIEKYRLLIDKIQTTSSDNIIFYSSEISNIIRTISFFSTLSKSKLLSQHGISYINLLQAKESAGVERAFINSILISKKVLSTDIQRIVSLYTSQKNYIENFKSLSTKNLISFYNSQLNTQNSLDVIKIRNLLLSHSVSNLDVYNWFKIATIRINALNKIENKIFLQLLQEIEINKKEIYNNILFQFIYIAIFFILIITISILIYKNISIQIQSFQKGLLSFFKYINKENDSYKLLDEKSNNEFGKMSKVLNKGMNSIVSHIETEVKKATQQEKLLFESNKLNSLGELIANISHQWKQPLSVISTGVTGMKVQKEYGVLSDINFYKNCDIINENVQNLSKTINSFQHFIEKNSQKSFFNLYKSINEFLILIDTSIKKYNIKIILDVEKSIKIYNYLNEFMQALLNIFNNSKDAFIKNKIKDKQFFIKVNKKNNFIDIQIKDNAGGIETNIFNRIFEPYSTTKHQSQGTGLGLHMTYILIVEGMKGKISAKNVQDTSSDNSYIGAEILISLPYK